MDAAKILMNMTVTWCRQTLTTPTKFNGCTFSGFRHEVDERCDLLGYYTASSGNSLPTFRDNQSAPFSRVYIATVIYSMIINKQYKKNNTILQYLRRGFIMWTNLKAYTKSTIFTLIPASQEWGEKESYGTAAYCKSPWWQMHMNYWNNN